VIGVYRITHTPSRRHYVGSSRDICQRWCEHRALLRRGKHPNTHLQNSWVRYGEGSFEFVLIEETSLSLCIERELYWISALQSSYTDGGFNLKVPDKAKGGFTHSAESVERMVTARKGWHHSEHSKRLISIGSKGHLQSNKLDVETVLKIREKLVEGLPGWKVAEMFNVSQPTVSEIRNRRTWKGV
jgi:group I intron endonuclease